MWLAQVEVVATDPSAAFHKTIRTHLSCAAVSVDTFHLIKLGNDALTAVRQRLVRDHRGRRGRLVDPAWKNRRLLLRSAYTLSPGGWARLEKVFRTDDLTDELGAAWGIKEQRRRLLTTSSLADAREAKLLLGHYVRVANSEESGVNTDPVGPFTTNREEPA